MRGKDVPNYAKVQGILLGTVAAFTFIIVMIGPEKHGAHFEKARLGFEEGAGEEVAPVGPIDEKRYDNAGGEKKDLEARDSSSLGEDGGGKEKTTLSHVEEAHRA